MLIVIVSLCCIYFVLGCKPTSLYRVGQVCTFNNQQVTIIRTRVYHTSTDVTNQVIFPDNTKMQVSQRLLKGCR